MSVQRINVPQPETDLEDTAELPVLDVAQHEDRLSHTDTWVAPVALPSAAPSGLEAELRAVSDSLRDLEGKLSRKSERLVALEQEIDVVRADREAAAARAADESRALGEARTALSQAETRSQTAEQLLTDRNLAVRALEDRGAELASTADKLRIEARDLRATLETRDDALRHRNEALARTEAALAEAQARIGAITQQEQTALRRAQALDVEVESLRTDSRRTSRDLETRSDAIARLENELARRERELVQLRTDHDQLRADAARRLEALHLAEGRRGVYEQMFQELDSQIVVRDTSGAEQSRELERREAKLRELEATLAIRDARIVELERAVAEQTDAVAARARDVEKITLESGLLTARVTSLEASLAKSSAESEEQAVARAQMESRNLALTAQLNELQARADRLVEMERLLSHLHEERSGLEAKHAADVQAAQALSQELETRVAEQSEMLRVLQEELSQAQKRVDELGDDLRIAEESILRLEADVRTKSSRVEELIHANDVQRTTIDEQRASLAQKDTQLRRFETEALNSAAALGNIQKSMQRLDPLAATGNEPAIEGAMRLLIRTDGDTEVVHVLGRRTTIGRTPDNDLQIDTKFISRHHAVVLAGPVYTLIEDLGSTNGVLVNNRRVTRHTLKDGDAVTVGKTAFRFVVRNKAS